MKFGHGNPHPLSQMRTELVWEGKYDEFGNKRELDIGRLSLPLQKIETIDEPMSRAQAQGSLFDERRAHIDNFRNRLIWGDNKLVCASLLSEFRGAFDVVYIDPPFDVGADFTMEIPIGESGELKKDQSILEMIAYRDTWGRGIDSYSSMIAERLQLIRELLRDTGSVFVHCDWRVSAVVRIILDEIFGRDNLVGEIVWQRTNARGTGGRWPRIHDVLLHYGKTSAFYFETLTIKADAKKMPHTLVTGADGRKYQTYELTGPGVTQEGESGRPWRGFDPGKFGRHWGNSHTQMDEWDAAGLIHWPKNDGFPRRRAERPFVPEEREVTVGDVWTDIDRINQAAKERLGYDTQKPEALIERVLASSAPGDALVGDFFCGSGTTLAVAERNGFRWIGCDLGRFSVHTTRKRMIDLQRELHEAERPYRSFDVYNLGRYERQWWQQRSSRKGANDEHRALVLKFFRAEPLLQSPSPLLHGRKGTAFVHVDGIDSVFSRGEVRVVSEAARGRWREQKCIASRGILKWIFARLSAAVEAELGVKVQACTESHAKSWSGIEPRCRLSLK